MPPSGVKCFVFQPDKEAKVRPGGNFWALNAVYPRSLAPFYPPLSFVHGTMMLCVKDRRWGRLKGGLQAPPGDRLPSQWPELAFCNGQTFHRPQTYSPTPVLFLHLAQLPQHSKVNNPMLYSRLCRHPQHAWNSRRTISRIFPIFHQIFHESLEEVERRSKILGWLLRLSKSGSTRLPYQACQLDPITAAKLGEGFAGYTIKEQRKGSPLGGYPPSASRYFL